MAKHFVKTVVITGGTAPSDSNDGLDPIGFNLSTATYDDTGNGEGEHHIFKTSAFTSYTFTAGDQVYLSGGAGITVGLYEIASKVDNDAILLVFSAGSDSTSDVTSSTGPWATVDKTDDAHAAYDTIFVCDDGTHSIAGAIVWGSGGFLTGCDARGVPLHPDGARVEIECSAVVAGFAITFGTTTTGNWHIRNVDIHSSGATGVHGSSTGWWPTFISCDFRDHATHGLETQNLSTPATFVGCNFYGNGGSGIQPSSLTSTGRGGGTYTRCSFHDNASVGMQAGGAGTCYVNECYFYRNGIEGMSVPGTGYKEVTNCVFYNNGLTASAGQRVGIYMQGGWTNTRLYVENCVFHTHADYGISIAPWATKADGLEDRFSELGNNVFYLNSNGDIRNSADDASIPIHATSVSGTDPLFASLTVGSEDFTPLNGSILIDAGTAGGPGAR